MRVVETFEEFCARHGTDPIPVGGGRWLLPDGASVTNNGLAPLLHEPPPDKKDRLELRRQYHAVRLTQAESDFAKLKRALTGATDEAGTPITFNWPVDRYGLPPTDCDQYGLPDGKAALLRLKEIVEQRRNTVTKIDAEISSLPEVVAQRERREQDKQWQQDRRSRDADRLHEIQSINL